MEIKNIKNPFNYLQLGLIAGICILFIYSSTSTQLVPNWNEETQKLLYPSGALEVPKSNVSINQAALGVILVIFLALSFAGEGTKKKDERLKPEEAQELLDNYLKKKKNIRLKDGTMMSIGNYHIDSNFLPRYKTDKTGVHMFRYVMQVRIKAMNKITHYLKGYVHPYERVVEGFVSMDGPLKDKDECPKCGKEYSEKIIDSEDYQMAKKVREDFK